MWAGQALVPFLLGMFSAGRRDDRKAAYRKQKEGREAAASLPSGSGGNGEISGRLAVLFAAAVVEAVLLIVLAVLVILLLRMVMAILLLSALVLGLVLRAVVFIIFCHLFSPHFCSYYLSIKRLYTGHKNKLKYFFVLAGQALDKSILK